MAKWMLIIKNEMIKDASVVVEFLERWSDAENLIEEMRECYGPAVEIEIYHRQHSNRDGLMEYRRIYLNDNKNI